MKYSEFTKIAQRLSKEYHIQLEDVEFEVSLWPEETPAEDGIRYLGEIHELMENQGGVMILSDGKRNIPANDESSHPESKPPSVYVPLHESSAPRVPPGTWVRRCITETLPDGRKVMAGKIAGDHGVMIRITRPLEGGTHSRLEFGLSWEAVEALHGVLCASICTREPVKVHTLLPATASAETEVKP